MGQTKKSNEELLQKMKKDIEILSKTASFNFDEPEKPIKMNFGEHFVEFSEPRHPNDDEIRDWIKSYLRYQYFGEVGDMTTQQYRSLKGQVVRRQYDGVFNFLEKLGCHIREDLEKYKETKPIIEAHIPVKISNPIPVVQIDLDVGGITNGNQT